MTKKYDYFVQIEELDHPVHDLRFAAKVPYIVKNPGPNSERVYPGFLEWLGSTKEEAEQQAKAEADRWIAQQID